MNILISCKFHYSKRIDSYWIIFGKINSRVATNKKQFASRRKWAGSCVNYLSLSILINLLSLPANLKKNNKIVLKRDMKTKL